MADSPAPDPASRMSMLAAIQRPGSGALLRWYVRLYRGNGRHAAVAIGLSLLQSIVLVPIPLLFKHIVDEVLPSGDRGALWLTGGVAALLYALHAAFAFGGRALTLRVTKRVTELLRARQCMQLQQMSLRFYDRERAGELHTRVVIDTENIDVMANAIIVNGIVPLLTFTLAACVLGWLNLWLLLLTLCFLPLYWMTHHRLHPRLREVNRGFRDQMAAMSTQVNELLQSIRLVKTFAREDHEQARAETRFRSVTHNALAMTIYGAFYSHVMGLLSNLALVGIYVGGGLFILRGSLTLGGLIAFTGLIGFLLTPLNTILGMLPQVYSGLASLGPVHTLLTLHQPLEMLEGKRPVADLKGEVRFENVTFSYERSEGRAAALRDLNAAIQPGETVALVGESGAGKSTFASLLLGFYMPEEGRVLVDGRDIREMNLRQLREKIGVVSQENVLLNTTIRDNLRYGRMDAAEEEIVEALRRAHALEFVRAIPEGLDAVVGDRGVRLSGGQRQRLAIARAFLKNPRILILDEATSALDSESEARIQEALDNLRTNRTCLIIAHRLSTVQSANRILVFREGRIVEQGTHEGLMAQGGEYARLARRQFTTEPAPSI